MRADRLLSILLILQRQGRATARQLATDLEVSERTIYRDINALSIAGVPVYGEPGPDGGYALLDNFRTFLTGLTDQEMQSLFMLSIPQPLSELGASQSLKSALLKIFASLPSGGQANEEWVRQRFLLDTTPWPGRHEASHRLQTIQQAVWQDHLLTLGYRVGPLAHDVEQVVMPYSLVAKAGAWYLVYAINGRTRVVRVATLTNVRALDGTFERPAGFDLGVFWQKWCSVQEEERATYRVTVRAASDSLASVDAWGIIDQPIRLVDEDTTWSILNLAFESLEDARSKILGLGRSVEVLEPAALRRSVADYAQQTLSIYQGDSDIWDK
jgi:predicted DNA-binding transcriptional regulator YafY